jgi:hypothetical protein
VSYRETRSAGSYAVRIPADVDMRDRVLGPLTARQLAILGVTGLVLYAAWAASRAFLPIPVFCPNAPSAGWRPTRARPPGCPLSSCWPRRWT